jgi:hypothetical protein
MRASRRPSSLTLPPVGVSILSDPGSLHSFFASSDARPTPPPEALE